VLVSTPCSWRLVPELSVGEPNTGAECRANSECSCDPIIVETPGFYALVIGALIAWDDGMTRVHDVAAVRPKGVCG
jgi:hypothetical protein